MPYVDSLFDIDTINAIRNERNYPASMFWKAGGKKLRDIVDECTFSINTVLYQQGAKLSAAVITPELTPVEIINTDTMESMPAIAYRNDDYFSRISVEFDPDLVRDIYHSYSDNQFEDLATQLYQFKVQFDQRSIVSDRANVETMAYERYVISWDIPPNLTVQFTDPIDFNFLDTVEFRYLMNGRALIPNAIYRVTSLSKIKRTATLQYHKGA